MCHSLTTPDTSKSQYCVRVCALHHSAKLSQGDFGHWLQLMHCTYLLVWSEYFRQKISMEINQGNRVLCPVTPFRQC